MIPPAVTVDPAVCHGRPVVRGTRVLVSNILSDLAHGRTRGEIIADYPGLTENGIRACLEFASQLAGFRWGENPPSDGGSSS